jgi:nucleoside-diphosphate-sugar epimerase
MSKVLITGGAGFIGFHLAKSLCDHGHTVVLVDNFARGVMDKELESLCGNDSITMITRDIREKNSLSDFGDNFAYIYHLAAIIGVTHVLDRPYDVLRENAVLLLNVIDFARRQRMLQRLVFASTSEVYAGTLAHFELPIPTQEDTPLAIPDIENPRTSYMLSKIYGEALCHHSGVPFSIVRPHNFYGPRMGLAHVIPELLSRAHKAPGGGKLEVFSVEHRRTFCYIDDAVEMIRRVAEETTCIGGTFNLGSQAPEVTIGELAKVIVSTVGRDLEIVTGTETQGSPLRRCPDTARATEATDYRPEIGLEEGVRRTYDWYRVNVFEGHTISAR